MVDQESLQNHADELFAGLSLEAPVAERNKGNGKFRLTVLADGEPHSIELDENLVHADMKTAVRELRDRLFPPKAEPEPEEDPVIEAEVVDAPVEFAAVSERQPAEPIPDGVTVAAPEVTADPFLAEKTRPDLPEPSAR